LPRVPGRRRWNEVPLRWALRLLASRLFRPLLWATASAYRRTVMRQTPVVAVIGSFGKTSTRAAIRCALGQRQEVREGAMGTGLAWSLLRQAPWRPAVLEVGISQPGRMAEAARLVRPTMVVVTSIGSEHWNSLGDREATMREKGAMIAALPEGGVVIANGDDERVLAMAARRPAGRGCVTFGSAAHNDVRVENVALDWPGGTDFRLIGADFDVQARIGMVGSPALSAALAAVAVGRVLGIDVPTLVARLRGTRPFPGRLQPVRLPSGAIVLRDDRKAALETVENALDFLAAVPARKRLAVLGPVTEPEGPQHLLYRNLGARAAAVVDRVLLVGQGHRDLARGAWRGGLAREAVTRHGGVHELAEVLAAELRDGDVVLLKGRTEQRLARVALLLEGVDVRCRLVNCYATGLACERCPKL
jgi:UDP-N-acetylmuramyl pentapeptide synthase